MRFFYCLLLTTLSFFYSCSQDSLSWICIPGIQVGPITSLTSEKDLIRIYGRENITRDTIFAEGLFTLATFLFPNTKNELKISWKDTINFAQPDWIHITKTNTDWKTDNNISIGTSLKELEKINEKHFTITGFGWDYGGTVVNWNGGKLEKNHTKPTAIDQQFIVRLSDLGQEELLDSEQSELSGDKEILTSNKTLQKLNPGVQEIIIIFQK